MADEVIEDDVNEAIRLVEKSRESVRPGMNYYGLRVLY
jgi:hypothetical protein